MTRTLRARFAVVAVVGVALVAASCGSDKNTSKSSGSTTAPQNTQTKVDCASGTISGAGSTFVQNLAQQWIKDFGAACPGATVNYQGVGSGAGIQQFTAGTVDFGASDALMKPEEEQAATAKGGDVKQIPWAAGGIAVMYNLSGVSQLKLSAETVASIFAGKIKVWNDPKIMADNSGASLPSTPIQVFRRADSSGTTNAFTSYLQAAAPTVWTSPPSKDWPATAAGQGAKGSDGVTGGVKQTAGAIGYAEVSFAKGAGLGMAKIKNAAGNFTDPSDQAVSAALAAAQKPADDPLKIKVSYTASDPAAYPIVTPTWVIVFAKPADPAKGKLLKAFLTYALGKGQDAAPGLSYAPLPKDLVTQDQAAASAIQA